MLDSRGFTEAVTSSTQNYIDKLVNRFSSPEVTELITPLQTFAAGGKRGRAKLVAIGYGLTGNDSNLTSSTGEINYDSKSQRELINLATAIELFQVFALIHDDIIDNADTRRGNPSLHRSYAVSMGETIGVNAAILAGDLAMAVADQALAAANPDQRLYSAWAEMCTEVAIGQYLDTRLEASPVHSVERSLAVIRSKSARYSVVYPLALGMIKASAAAELVNLTMNAVLPWGEAFQLRDDELGVYGDAALTGKPSGNDLREGKKTVLIALTSERCCEAPQLSWLGTAMNESKLEQLRSLIKESGAYAEHEKMIHDRWKLGNDRVTQLPIADLAKKRLLELGKTLIIRRR